MSAPGWIPRAARALQATWTVVGVTLLLLLAPEACARVYYAAVELKGPADHRWQRDAFHGAPWARAYFDEVIRSVDLEWRSYVYWRRRPFDGEFIHVDGEGLRRTWAPPARSGPAIHVWVLGGSTAWGMGARDDFTIPSLLAKKLAAALPATRIEVTNYGELGYVSTQDLIALQLELRRGRTPDVALFYGGANDVGAAYQDGTAGVPQNEDATRRPFEAPFQGFVELMLRDSAAARPILWRLRERIWQAANERRGADAGRALARDVAQVYAGNARIVEALGKEHGFESLFVWQPTVFDKPTRSPDELLAAREEAFMEMFFGEAYADVRAHFAAAPDSRFHDVSDTFRSYEQPVFFDFVHVTEGGNEALADRILPALRELVAARAAFSRGAQSQSAGGAR